MFPSVADKTSFPFPFQNSLQNPLHQIPLQIQIYFVQRVCPPNPHLLLLDGPFPSSNFMRSVFPANCPDSRGNNTFFGTHLLHLALSPCHVSPSTSAPLVLPPTICYLSRSRSLQFVASSTSFRSTTHTHPYPFSNLNNVGSCCQWLRCACTHALLPVAQLSLSFSSVLPSNTIPRNHSG